MLKYITLTFILISLAISVNAQPFKLKKKEKKALEIFTKTYDTLALHQDFEFIKNAIINGHPGALRYTTKAELENSYQEILKQINKPLTEKEFRFLVLEWIEKIKCAHTTIFASNAYTYATTIKMDTIHRKRTLPFLKSKKVKRVVKKPQYLPFEYAIVNDEDIYITKNHGDDSTIKSFTKILDINGNSAKTIIDKFYKRLTMDGYSLLSKSHYAAKLFNGLYNSSFDTLKTKQLVITDSSNVVKTVSLKGKNEIEFVQQPTFSLKYIGDSIGIIRLKSFSGKAQRNFYKKTFKELNEKKISNLIIDLRSNGGGRIRTCMNLLAYLMYEKFSVEALQIKGTKPYIDKVQGAFVFKLTAYFLKNRPKIQNGDTTKYYLTQRVIDLNHYNKKLYVITNGGSFSASSIVSAYLKKSKRATFIGEETGGAENGCNAFNMPSLPTKNTKIQVRYPLYQVNHKITSPNYGRGTMPDIAVDERLMIRKLKDGQRQDWCVRAIIDDIKQNAKK